jgi:hypothetical protein
VAGCEKAYLYYSSLKKHIRLSHPMVFHDKIASNQSKCPQPCIKLPQVILNCSSGLRITLSLSNCHPKLQIVTMNDCLAPDETTALVIGDSVTDQ